MRSEEQAWGAPLEGFGTFEYNYYVHGEGRTARGGRKGLPWLLR